MNRLSPEEYYISLAKTASLRSTCLKIKVGAILVKGRKIIAEGYNGAPNGMPHCEDVGCLIYHNNCIRVVHAELNAIIKADDTKDSSLYTTHLPCLSCCNAIINAEVSAVYYAEEYIDHKLEEFQYTSQKEYLLFAGVKIEKVIYPNIFLI